jgi:sterol desaturase/sphingolipid hydroxylase (fatty acid hydroxylase superfamily)
MNTLIEYDQIIRLSIFLGLLIIFAVAEFYFPLAKRKSSRAQQWSTNLGIVLIDTIVIKLLFPLLAVGVAKYANLHSIGIFNVFEIPYLLTIILSLFMLDLLIYSQHVVMHRVPILWRLHRMHHTEISLDVTSALRFHPIEIIISMLIKMTFVLFMGVPVLAVIIFEVLLNGFALFNHSNLKLPAHLDKQLRKVIVTPEVHWIHHSQIVKETNSNYGFNLIIWDKMFSTYRALPSLDYTQMQQGLKEFGLTKPLGFFALLISPFKSIKNSNSTDC